MSLATSRVTVQNQISIPAQVRRRFRIAPGTELVWEDRDGELVIRPKKYSLEDLQAFCRPHAAKKRYTLEELKAGLGRAYAGKHARR